MSKPRCSAYSTALLLVNGIGERIVRHRNIVHVVTTTRSERSRLSLSCCSAGSLNRPYNQVQHSIHSHGPTTACLSSRILQLKLATLVRWNIAFLTSIVLGNSKGLRRPYTSPINSQQSAVAIFSQYNISWKA